MTLARTPSPAPVDVLLPHRRRLKLVDTVLDYGREHLKVALTVRDEAPFGDGAGGVPAYLGLEYMAQAICAFSGLELNAAGETPKIGLLLGTRCYRAHTPRFLAGQTLEVFVQRVMGGAGEVWVFDGRITDVDQNLFAEAQVKAYRPDDIRGFLREQTHGG